MRPPGPHHRRRPGANDAGTAGSMVTPGTAILHSPLHRPRGSPSEPVFVLPFCRPYRYTTPASCSSTARGEADVEEECRCDEEVTGRWIDATAQSPFWEFSCSGTRYRPNLPR